MYVSQGLGILCFLSGTKNNYQKYNIPANPPDKNGLEPIENAPMKFLYFFFFSNLKLHGSIGI